MIAPAADLEVTLRRATGGYAAELRFTPGGSSAPVRLIEGDPPLLTLDEAALGELQAARTDMAVYAASLSTYFYADLRLREAMARALAASAGAGAAVRLRLVLDEREPVLHTLHWEALQDPSGRGPLLGLSERVRLVRFLSSADLEPLRPRPLATLRALVVVSSGEDLDAYQLAPLEVEAEVGRARAALGDLPTTVLQTSPTTHVTINRLVEALRNGPDLLYLIAHGTLHRGQPFLWLEDDDGFAARVNARLLIEQIQALSSRPLLVVLGSCQSAGNNAVEGALTALGPQLASAGIGAVLAFQGNLQIHDAATLLPVFLRELRRDGQVDRAVAAARVSLMERGTWWQPVLWLRMLDGQLWTTSEPVVLEPAAPTPPPHNLPAELDALVGRTQDLAIITTLLADPVTRLLTLVGPGGAGKTRLAVALGWHVQSSYPDGVWLIELTSLRDPALLLPSIAQVLGVKEVADTSLLELLQTHLRTRRMLLILDNFEQIAPAASQVAQLLAAAPALEVMVTSRVALRISGEQEFAVSPLPIPDPTKLPVSSNARLELLAANPAVALFVRRATAVRQGFTLNEQNMDAILQLVSQLDGLPLAIELAAARSRLLTPQALLGRLGDRLGLLTGGARDRAAHQQTLRATIAWSYDLLSPAEQRLFERLAVFAGGCTLEAVEAVCNPTGDLDYDLFEGIAALVEESLLRAHEHPDGSSSVSMLTTIRAFALERLAAHPHAPLIWKSFADYYLALAQAADCEARGPNPGPALDQFEREHVNLRTALEWALETQAITTASDLATVLWWFWHVRGYLSEGRTRLAAVLVHAAAIPALQVATLRLGAGNLALAQADYLAAAADFHAALAIYEQERTLAGITRTLNSLGITALRQGQYEQARTYYERSLALCRELGLRAGIVTLLNNLGLLAMNLADFAQARSYYEESLALALVDQDRARQALALSNLGLVAIFQGDLAQAIIWLDQGLPLCRSLGDQSRTASILRSRGLAALLADDVPLAGMRLDESLRLRDGLHDRSGVTYCLDGIASLAARQGAHRQAARLWGAAQALRSAIGAILPPADQLWLEREQAQTRATLDPGAFAAATAAGAALDHETAVNEALLITSQVMASDPAHRQTVHPPVQ